MSEIIGKLSPQSCQPIRLAGAPGINAADISHALSTSGRIGYILIGMKYMDDLSGFSELEDLLLARIEDEAQKDHWKRSRLPCLVNLSITEYIGHKIWKDSERARILAVHASVWSRVWRYKYLRLIEILEAYEQSTLHLVRNRLKS